MTSFIGKAVAASLLAVAATGVAAADDGGAVPASLAPAYQRLAAEGGRNAVLNHMEIGARAIELGRREIATPHLDQALALIESVYGNTEGARKARSLWYEEGSKDFKGEPYERVMAYYYRGLLYLQERDYGNARASFEGGMLQDAFAEEEQNRFDFALMAFLSGWASQLERNDVMQRRAYDEVKKLRPDFELPAAGHDTLLVIETGNSPRKLADGVGHYELVYRRGKFFTETRARVTIAGKPVMAYPMEDIFWQATSRGGRAVDRIVKGKAQFRNTNEGMGTALSDVANTMQVLSPLSGGLGQVAGAVGAVGALQLIVASRVQAKADTRYWSSLPDLVHVLPLKSAGQTVEIEFLDKNGVVLPELKQVVTLPANGGLAWVRARPAAALK